MARLVRPGGRLAGFFFFDDNAKGPSFGISPEALQALVETSFRWQVWERL